MRTSGFMKYLSLAVLILSIHAFIPSVEAREQLLDSLEKEMMKLVQRIRPSVVSVVAYCRTSECYASRLAGAKENTTPLSTETPLLQTNIGSGCIIDANGYIVTTENVIHNGHEFEVTFSDGQRKIAQRVGSDPESNIAVLRVEGSDYIPAKTGNSDQMNVGSWITIVGNSFGLSSAVSFGLVNGIREEDGLIQLSAPVSPGNSGAVAINTKGEVIGFVVAAVSEPVLLTIGAPGTAQQQVQQLDLRSQGASLAIPVNRAQEIAAELIDHGVYERGWLGLTIRDLSPKQVKDMNIHAGVLVVDVLTHSPAAAANILQGDVILQYDGHRVTTGKALFERVQSSKVGEKVAITISRQGQEHTMSTEIAQRPIDLSERLAKETDGPQTNTDSFTGTPPQYMLSNGSIEKRIELLEEEIRKLRKLIRKEK